MALILVLIILVLLVYLGSLQSRVADLERQARGEPTYLDLATGDSEAVEWFQGKHQRESLERLAARGDRHAAQMLEMLNRNDALKRACAEADELLNNRGTPLHDDTNPVR